MGFMVTVTSSDDAFSPFIVTLKGTSASVLYSAANALILRSNANSITMNAPI